MTSAATLKTPAHAGLQLEVSTGLDDDDQTHHAHGLDELVIVVDGPVYCTVQDQARALPQGRAMVIPARTVHALTPGERASALLLRFGAGPLPLPVQDLANVAGYQALFLRRAPAGVPGGTGREAMLDRAGLRYVQKLVRQIETELRGQAPGYLLMASSVFMQLLGFLSRACNPVGTPGGRACPFLEDTLRFLEDYFSEDLTVDVLARRANVSKRTLFRAFRKATGQTPIEYLTHLRVSKAALLLRETDLTVTDIAYSTGFSDGNYFAKQFRKVMGQTPSGYRDAAAAGRASAT